MPRPRPSLRLIVLGIVPPAMALRQLGAAAPGQMS